MKSITDCLQIREINGDRIALSPAQQRVSAELLDLAFEMQESVEIFYSQLLDETKLYEGKQKRLHDLFYALTRYLSDSIRINGANFQCNRKFFYILYFIS